MYSNIEYTIFLVTQKQSSQWMTHQWSFCFPHWLTLKWHVLYSRAALSAQLKLVLWNLQMIWKSTSWTIFTQLRPNPFIYTSASRCEARSECEVQIRWQRTTFFKRSWSVWTEISPWSYVSKHHNVFLVPAAVETSHYSYWCTQNVYRYGRWKEKRMREKIEEQTKRNRKEWSLHWKCFCLIFFFMLNIQILAHHPQLRPGKICFSSTSIEK